MSTSQASVTVAVKADTSQLARTARIVAKHLTALADELEAPDGIITFPDGLTKERSDAIKDWADTGVRPASWPGTWPAPDRIELCGQPTVLGGYASPCTRLAGHDPALGHQVI